MCPNWKVGGEPKEVVPAAGWAELVELVVIQISFPDDSFFLKPLTLLAAAAVAATAAGRGAHSVHASQH